MTSREDLLKRAAECRRLMDRETDHLRKAVFGLIRDMWIALANERASMNPGEVAQQVAAIARIQLGFEDDGKPQ
jgi:hypothetical protein